MGFKIGNIYFIAAIAVIGGGLFGFDISSMSAVLTNQAYLCTFNQGQFNATTGQMQYRDDAGQCYGPTTNVQGGITASMPGGSWAGALISGFLSDFAGRKTSIQVGAVIWCVGCVIVAASQNIPMLIVGRVINGISVGICSAQVPVYISEISPPSMRGRLVGMQQWAITWGIMIMFYICFGTTKNLGASTAAFRIPWAVQAVPAILLGIGLMFLPESPRWLYKKERESEALDVLTLVHGRGDPNAPIVTKEMREIRDAVQVERQNADVTYLELFKPHMINRTHIGLFTQIWSQLTGMNVMMYYIAYVFQMTGSNNDLVASSITYVINVVMTVPALIWLDRWGRRMPLLVGAFFMCLWMCVNAGLFGAYSRPSTPEDHLASSAESMVITGPPAKAVIAATYLFVVAYAPTWGPVSWTYPPELYPLRVRGKAVSLATSANWAFNFALAYFVPPAFENISWRVYVIFAVFCFAMFWHVFFMFPETANKTLEEVEGIFEAEGPGSIKHIGIPAWKTRNDRSIVRVEQGVEDLEGSSLEKGKASGERQSV